MKFIINDILCKGAESSMKRFVIIQLVALAFTGHAFAADNLCSAAGQLVNSTTSQIDKFADKNTQRTFDGSGRIRDVKSGGLASKATVVIDCGNNVIVEVPTSSPRAANNPQIGESISFSGKLNSVSRRRYVDSHGWYLMVGLDDNSSVW
jgi:hypothetical protein